MAALGRILAALLMLVLAGSGAARAETYENGLEAFESEDYDRAYQIWQPLADAGNPVAQYSLGKLFERGGGAIRQDFAQAARWYKVAAKAGIAAAQNNLALMHAQGRGLPRDVEKAIGLWLQASRQNHPMAQYNLGLAYFRGEGVGKEEREAAGWFRRAADAGLADAQYAMGQMNRLGLVLPKDESVALGWYKLAGAQGHREAKMQVQLLEATGLVAEEPGDPIITPKGLAVAEAETEAAQPEATSQVAAQPAAQVQQQAAAPAPAKPVVQPEPVQTAAMTGPTSEPAVPEAPRPQAVAAAAAAPQPVSPQPASPQPAAAAQPTQIAAAIPLPRRKPAVPAIALQVAALPATTATDSDAAAAPPSEPQEDMSGQGGETVPDAARNAEPEPVAMAEAAPVKTPALTQTAKTAAAEAQQPVKPIATFAPAPKAEQPEQPVVASTGGAGGTGGSEGQQLVAAPPAEPAPELAKEPTKQPAKPIQIAAAPSGAGAVGVWLASENSPEKAMALWPKTQSQFPGLLDRAKPAVAKVSWGNAGTFYRLVAGPLPNTDQAAALCAAMRQKDEDAFCLVMASQQ